MRLNYKHICTSLLIMLAVFCSSSGVFAGTFYMAPNGSNSTGDGSRENPYLKLSWIADNVLTPGAGDTVMVMSGTHGGDASFIGYSSHVKGNPDAYLVIMADPLGETRPVIDAAFATPTCWSIQGRHRYPSEDNAADKLQYVKITGIDFIRGASCCVAFADGFYEGALEPAHHIIVEDCGFGDTNPGGNHDALRFLGVDTFLVKDCAFFNVEREMFDIVGSHYGTITGCTFVKPGSILVWGQGAGIIMKGGSNNILIDRCYFKTVGYGGIYIGQATGWEYWRPPLYTIDGDGDLCDYEAKNIVVYRSVFVDMSNPICFASSRGGGVYNCTFYCPVKHPAPLEDEPTGIAYMFKIYSFSTVAGGYNLVWPRDGEVINNVVVHMGTYSSTNRVVWTQSSTTLPETFLFSHNLWYDLEDPANSGPDWDLLANLYGSPQHDNDIMGDPMFAGGSYLELPEHFQLTEGSPAAAAGTEFSYQIYDYFTGRYLNDLDFNNRVWSSPRSLGAFGMTVSGAPLSGPNVHKLLPADLQPIFND